MGNGEYPVLGISGHAPLPSYVFGKKQLEEGIGDKAFGSA
jgi:hypothetical protein